RKDGKTTTTGLTTTVAKTSGITVDKKTNALRVLVIPMGDGSNGILASSQFTSTDQTSTQNGFSAPSRTYPVPSGIAGVVGTTTSGIRYVIDTSTILNLKAVPGAYDGSNPSKFCGTGGNFDAIKAQLAAYMQSWNANPLNANSQVDRVLGVVGESISD